MKVIANNDILTRQKLANPFSEMKMMDRLKAAKAIDLRDNHIIERLDNGYVRITPIDPTKTF